jgi:microcystin-dependent protein
MSSLDGGIEATQGRTGPADDRPLTQQEYQLLQRLLSDPFSIPIQFKTWLVSYLETSDMNLPISSIQGLTTLLGIAGVGSGTLGLLPAGLIFPHGGTTAPAGAKMCDGASYSRTAEARLYNEIGTAFGANDSATFKVPDIQGRMPVGLGSHVDVSALGKSEGSPLASRRPKHSTSINQTPHSHAMPNPAQAFNRNSGTGSTGTGGGDRSLVDVVSTNAGNAVISAGPQTGDAPVDTPAFIVLNFIIVA